MSAPLFGLLQPYLDPYVGWFYADSLWWTVIGLAANIIFGSRFVVQWYVSERKKQLVVPPIFWHLSFWGSIIQLIYGFHVDKLPVILGYLFLPFIYGRSLVLLKKGNPQTADERAD